MLIASANHWCFIKWNTVQIGELRNRLPPFQVKQMGLEEDAWRVGRNVTEERLDRVLQVSGFWVGVVSLSFGLCAASELLLGRCCSHKLGV